MKLMWPAPLSGLMSLGCASVSGQRKAGNVQIVPGNISPCLGQGHRALLFLPSPGPLAGTVLDFWHMVWQEKTSVIVMLTGLVEQSKVGKTSQAVLSLGIARAQASTAAALPVQLSVGAESSSAALHCSPCEFACTQRSHCSWQIKCEQYWPEQEQVYGDFTVTLNNTWTTTGLVKRIFCLQKVSLAWS